MLLKPAETRLMSGKHMIVRTAVSLALGDGAAAAALLAFHQLIVKRTAVAEVRDRGESDGFQAKNSPF